MISQVELLKIAVGLLILLNVIVVVTFLKIKDDYAELKEKYDKLFKRSEKPATEFPDGGDKKK